MMKNKWVILALLIVTNACGVVMAQHVFASDSTWSKVLSVLGAVTMNLLALFGQPVVSGAQAAAQTAQTLGRKAAFLLPLVFIGVAGCATMSPAQKAFNQKFLDCMEQKGISAATSVGQEAWTDLSQGTSQQVIVGQLEGLAGRAGVDTVGCAVTSWLGQPGGSKNPAGVEAAKAYLAKHQMSADGRQPRYGGCPAAHVL
jgi:hypothetical protein